MDEHKELFEVIDSQIKILVGILLKRVEVLEKEKVLNASLYKSLTKETLYEWARNLKNIINIGSVKFINKPKE